MEVTEADDRPSATGPPRAGWLWPAFGLTSAASVALAVMVSWLVFQQLPALRRELVAERQLRERREADARSAAAVAATARASQAQARGVIEGNVPLIILRPTGDISANSIAIPAGAGQIVLWMETEASAPSFRVEIRTGRQGLRHVIDGLQKNPSGALTLGLPPGSLEAGAYLVRLLAVTDGSPRLVQEYPLEIRPAT